MAMVKSTLKEFAENTSAHGVNKIVTAKGWFIKVVWLVLFLGASSMIVYNTSRLVTNYIRKPVRPTTTIKTNSIYFPSVTICNLNPALYTKVKKLPELHNIISQVTSTLGLTAEHIAYLLDDPFALSAKLVDTTNSTVVDVIQRLSEAFGLLLNSLGSEAVQSLSQPIENFLVTCSFVGVSCSAGDFSVVSNGDYGTCYQFPNFTKYPNGIEMFSAGPLFGLSLVLNINQKEYVPFVTSAAGVRVRIHEFRSDFYMLEQGQSFPPGFETSIGIRPGCQRGCLETVIDDICNCTRLAKVENNEDSFEVVSIRACTSKDIPCIKTALQKKKDGSLSCGYCKYPCRKYRYQTTTSMMRYPSTLFDPALRYILNQWKNEEDMMYTEAQTRQNIISLKVYFSDLELEINNEVPAYPPENLLSDIGGQLGLWLGISVLSICECFELMYMIVRNMFKTKHPKIVDAPGDNS